MSSCIVDILSPPEGRCARPASQHHQPYLAARDARRRNDCAVVPRSRGKLKRGCSFAPVATSASSARRRAVGHDAAARRLVRAAPLRRRTRSHRDFASTVPRRRARLRDLRSLRGVSPVAVPLVAPQLSPHHDDVRRRRRRSKATSRGSGSAATATTCASSAAATTSASRWSIRCGSSGRLRPGARSRPGAAAARRARASRW